MGIDLMVYSKASWFVLSLMNVFVVMGGGLGWIGLRGILGNYCW